MSKIVIPEGYKTPLSVYEMQRAIEFIKSNFQVNLGQALNLRRVSAPLFVDENSGLNDNLNGVERPVSFDIPDVGSNVKRNESRTILVIVPDICDPFFSEIIRGIEVTAAEQGYLVLIGDCAHQNQQEKTFIDLIITKQIDGMLLLGSRLPFDASIER